VKMKTDTTLTKTQKRSLFKHQVNNSGTTSFKKNLDKLSEIHHSKINISFLSLVANKRHAPKQLIAISNKIRSWQDTLISSYICLHLTVAIHIRTKAIFPKAIDFYIKG